MTEYSLVLKPTFTNQLFSVPRSQLPQVLSKIKALQSDPTPDGHLKKKLKGYAAGIYRIRSGDYRIFYTFSKNVVCIIGIDDRQYAYRGKQSHPAGMDVEGLVIPAVDAVPELDDWLDEPPDWNGQAPSSAEIPEAVSDELPRPLDVGFLERLRVESRYFPTLLKCTTLDDLAAADVPDRVRDRVFDCVMATDLDRVLQQPEYLVEDVSELLEFVDGRAPEFLLRLGDEQTRVVQAVSQGRGPHLLKGVPGTGKTLVGMYSVHSMLQRLRSAGIARPRILYVTYQRSFVTVARRQLAQILERQGLRVTTDGDEISTNQGTIKVRTIDSYAGSIVAHLQVLKSDKQAPAYFKLACSRVFSQTNGSDSDAHGILIARLSDEHLLAELNEVIAGRQLETLEQYLACQRLGRKVRLSHRQRTAVWKINQAFENLLRERRLLTWPQMHGRALEAVRSGVWRQRFDGVIIDEAQDLDLPSLRLLVALCKSPTNLFIAADANQTIHQSAFRWSDVADDLSFRGRTTILRKVYRSTKEILQAANSYLAAMPDEAVESPDFDHDTMRLGDRPKFWGVTSQSSEIPALRAFLRRAISENHIGYSSCAVLAYSNDQAKYVVSELTRLRIPARLMQRDDVDLEFPGVKVMTLHGAKGLEFPVVAIVGLSQSQFLRDASPNVGVADGEDQERVLRHRRAIYVAMTRAMWSLLVIAPADHTSPLLQGIGDRYWDVSEWPAPLDQPPRVEGRQS